MIDPNKRYRTRDGREVRIYAVDGGGGWPVHGAFKESNGWHFCTWTASGTVGSYGSGDGDLVEIKPRIKRTVWLNVYPAERAMSSPSPSKQIADEIAAPTRIACVKVEIDVEEGHGL